MPRSNLLELLVQLVVNTKSSQKYTSIYYILTEKRRELLFIITSSTSSISSILVTVVDFITTKSLLVYGFTSFRRELNNE